MRLVNRLVALLLGFAAIAAAALIVTEVIRAGIGSDPWLVSWPVVSRFLSSRSWSDSSVLIGLGVIAGVGLLLVLGQLIPRRSPYLRLADAHDGIDSMLSKRALAHLIDAIASTENGVADVSTVISRRLVTIRVRMAPARHSTEFDSSGSSDNTDVAARIERRATEQIDGIRLAKPPRIRVWISGGGDR